MKDGLPINEENLQRTAAAMAAVGPFARRRAAQLGRQMAKTLQDILDGINNATRP